MASKINTLSKRLKLSINHNPHWEKISRGRFIGYRKAKRESAWTARFIIDKKTTAITFKKSQNWEYETALDAANDWFNSIIGIDIDAINLTLNDAIDRYEKEMSIKKTPLEAKANVSRLKKHLSDKLKETLLRSVTREKIKSFQNTIVRGIEDPESLRKRKATANRILNILKAVLNLAYQDGKINSKAEWDGVKPFEDVSVARKLYLTPSEIKNFIETTSLSFKELCLCCIYTGNRVGSLRRALVKDFDILNKSLRLESAKGSGKKKIWECFLSDKAFDLLKQLSKGKKPKDHLLTDDEGQSLKKNGYRSDLLDAKKISNMPDDFDMYAFRHYHISRALLSGAQPQVIAENCGTSVRMIEQHYGKFIAKDRQNMINNVELGI